MNALKAHSPLLLGEGKSVHSAHTIHPHNSLFINAFSLPNFFLTSREEIDTIQGKKSTQLQKTMFKR